MASLHQLYSQAMRSTEHDRASSRLVVSEDLWFVCVLNGACLDFYDLSMQAPEMGARAFKFLSTTRIGDAPATEAALCPHDPSILAVGTDMGGLTLFRLRRSISPASVLAGGPVHPSGPLLELTHVLLGHLLEEG